MRERGVYVCYMTIFYFDTTFVGESYAADVVVTEKGSPEAGDTQQAPPSISATNHPSWTGREG